MFDKGQLVFLPNANVTLNTWRDWTHFWYNNLNYTWTAAWKVSHALGIMLDFDSFVYIL